MSPKDLIYLNCLDFEPSVPLCLRCEAPFMLFYVDSSIFNLSLFQVIPVTRNFSR